MRVIETNQRVVRFKRVEERDFAINCAMKELYDAGCRRLRAVKLPTNGDYVRIRVMGWQT